jgi:hypothetical protein
VTSRALTLVLFISFVFVSSPAVRQSAAAAAAQASDSAKKDGQAQTKDQAAPEDATGFDERAAAKVLGTIRDGLESRSQRHLLSVFDAGKMDGFLTFEDQIDAYFSRYESFRVTFRIIQTSEENNRGVILAEFQLENEPRGGGNISLRQGQLRFELERSAKGWKIVDFNPREFFS